MSKPAIKVEKLGKRYRIRTRDARYGTLRDSLTRTITAPFRVMHSRLSPQSNGSSSPASKSSSDTIWALKDISFEVKPGEVVGIIGRNGAGKSTLLKVLSRITEPTTGAVDIYGRVGSLLEVGTGFHPELSGRENIFLNGAILGMRKTEIVRKFDEIVAFAEVEKFIDTPVKHYSSGMYVRLAFAVAAHLEPEILLVDEVLAVGDAAFQKKCLGKMSDVAKQGRTVLFVSHNMSAIQQLCSHALLINGGQLELEGPAAKVIPHYLSDSFGSDNGDFDLSNHPGRMAGSSAPIIRHLALYSSNGHPTTSFYPDEEMVVQVVIEPTSMIREPRIAVAIEDSFGQRITTVASYFQNTPLKSIGNRCQVRCKLPRLDLGAGRYLVSVSVRARMSDLFDGILNAGWFEVLWRNNYGNGEAYESYYGPVLKESSWEVVD